MALAEELGENAKFIRHDVTNAEDWKKVIGKAEASFGPVNILVNNAGIVTPKTIEEFTEEEFRRVIDINLIGVFLGMKTVLPSMKKAGNGSIINISSINGFRAAPGNSAYDASKFAVRGITKTAALEFAEFGIRVNSVHPGPIQTPIIQTEETQAMIDEMVKGIPLNRIGTPEDVSKLVLFLASDESSYSTGSAFTIDGGVTASN
ncbi:3-alpha-hydroxysteroid dehydrogenase [Compostibacillus humi]|uniref:3-alpha-hydroxysteroid dehydrogenase n=1 Tax=Compostibacillus humi TaxID=1245525 RepID=A0A8J2TQ54_9BACI|nr:3-alpha-hydroxysteroid dehydrogenase [Compostibacillus humi]